MECGGCRGLGKHSRRCPTQPGAIWFILEDQAISLANSIGANEPELASIMYGVAGRLRQKAELIIASKDK